MSKIYRRTIEVDLAKLGVEDIPTCPRCRSAHRPDTKHRWWTLNRIHLPNECRRIIRAGFEQDGDSPSFRLVGAYVRTPGTVYSVVVPALFRP